MKELFDLLASHWVYDIQVMSHWWSFAIVAVWLPWMGVKYCVLTLPLWFPVLAAQFVLAHVTRDFRCVVKIKNPPKPQWQDVL